MQLTLSILDWHKPKNAVVETGGIEPHQFTVKENGVDHNTTAPAHHGGENAIDFIDAHKLIC